MAISYANLGTGSELNLLVMAGCDATLTFAYDASTPRDFTGASYVFNVKKTYTGAVLATWVPVGTVTSGNTSILVTFDAATMALLPTGNDPYDEAGTCVYNLIVTSATNKKECLLRGLFQVVPKA